MTAKLVVLSDMHFGYDLSLADDPDVQDRAVGNLAHLCGGSVKNLVLNGDCFEGCVPRDAGHLDGFGFSPAVTQASSRFFTKLLEQVEVGKLTIVWGNHDLCLWQKLAAACGVPVFTNDYPRNILLQVEGLAFQGSEDFLASFLGPDHRKFSVVCSAYPNYVLKSEEGGWPYLAFHHGHLLDDLVLGQEDALKYAALLPLTGHGRPRVNLAGDLTVRSLHDATFPFLSSLYEYDSAARRELWSLIRRGDAGQSCPSSGDPFGSLLHAELLQEGLGRHVKWYCDLLTADPTTPAPIGDKRWQSYLFVGHDHRGGACDILGMDGMPWTIVNTGGWTAEGGCRTPHTHAVVWVEGKTEPGVHCL